MQHRRDKKKAVRNLLLLIAAFAAVVVCGLAISAQDEPQGQQLAVLSDDFEARKVITVGDRSYREKGNLTEILLIGYDKTEAKTVNQFRDGGQSDFMLLLVIDRNEKKVHRLLLNRDTMAEIGILSVLGKDVGTNTLQLCLAHGYGTSPQDCNERTVTAVSRMLQGVDIGFYVAMPMSAIPRLNDAIGGVDVLIEDDFSAVDAALVQGQTVHLEGEHAMAFLRRRQQVGDGSNTERMRRHRAYIDAAGAAISGRIKQDGGFVNSLLNTMDDVLETNMSKGRLINEVNRAYQYDILPTDTFEGEYKLGANGFREFYVDEDAVVSWVLDTFYTPVN